MSLENAILRRARLGQSFCSYTFKTGPKVKGFTLIKVQKQNKVSSTKSKTSLALTTDTPPQSVSQLKSTQQFKTTKSTLMKTSPKQNDKFVSFNTSFQFDVQEKPAEKEINRMDQYLTELYELRAQPKYKFNTFEYVPKIMRKPPGDNENFQREKFFQKNSHMRLDTHLIKQNNLVKENNVKKVFDCKKFHYFFHDFSLEDNSLDVPFTKVRIICLESGMYIECPIGEKIFSEMPIKRYCNELNALSTSLQANIFYICLSKQCLQNQQIPYTQCFFWLSRPFKHNERPKALKVILGFYVKCCRNLEIQKLPMKIWIVDFNGKISFINKEEVERQIQLKNSLNSNFGTQKQKASIISNYSPVGSVCLNMFLSTMSKGDFISQGNINTKGSGIQTPQQ